MTIFAPAKLTAFTFVLLCMVVAWPPTEATNLNCGVVARDVGQCIPYLRGGPGPSSLCCGGVETLAGLASTPEDRRTACGCLKSAAGSIQDLNYARAAALPGRCGVRIPYAISPKTDCSKVN